MSLLVAILGGAAFAATLEVGRDAPSVQETIQLAAPRDTVVVPEGLWPGPVHLDRAITLTSRGGTIDGNGTGTVLTVDASGAIVQGLSIARSGTDLQQADACIKLTEKAKGATIRDNRLDACLFGIWVNRTWDALVEGNHVKGRPDLHPSNRGNGVHLYDGERLVIRGNLVEGARDGVYVSATENSLIEGNITENQRYGIHYMYSHDNIIRGNISRNNSGGIALMQSERLVVEQNIASDNKRQGILFRDVMHCSIAHNTTERNQEGMFFFSSLDNDIHHNLVAGNEIGARVWAGTKGNRVWANAFVGNRQQVFYVAAEDDRWGTDAGGNHWSDQLGWDQDKDGIGDRPYQVGSLVANLLYRTPAAVLLLNSPTLELLARAQRMLPALRVPTIIDPEPLVRARGNAGSAVEPPAATLVQAE